MRNFKRLLTLGLALMMVFALAACNGAATPTAAPTTGSTTTAAPTTAAGGDVTTAPDEPEERDFYEISVYVSMHASASLEDVPEGGYMKDKMFEEMFNVKFDFIRIPNVGQEEVYNVTMASGQIPDVVNQGSWTSLNKYVDAWKPLNDFIIGKYENLENYFFNDDYVYALAANDDGQLRIISMLSEQFIGDILLVRGDLVEEWGLNIDDYKTKEDYADLLRFVQQTDPTIVPFMTRMKTEGLINRLCESWSGIRMCEMVDVDDIVKYGAADPRMKDVVEYLSMLYSEKLIDQEFPTNETAPWQEQLLNDGIFMTHDNASSRIRWADTEWAKLGVTGKYYQAMPLIQVDENTKGTTTIHYPKLRDSFAIFIGCEDGKVDRILEMSNYNYSEEGFILHTYGIEGVSFYIDENGVYQHVPEYKAAIDADDRVALPMDQRVSATTVFGRIEQNGIYSIDNRDQERVQAAARMYEDGGLIRRNMLDVIRFTDEENGEITTMKAELKTYAEENLVKFIIGAQSLDNWDSYIAGYQRIGMGLDAYLEMYNTAYQRALARVGN